MSDTERKSKKSKRGDDDDEAKRVKKAAKKEKKAAKKAKKEKKKKAASSDEDSEAAAPARILDEAEAAEVTAPLFEITESCSMSSITLHPARCTHMLGHMFASCLIPFLSASHCLRVRATPRAIENEMPEDEMRSHTVSPKSSIARTTFVGARWLRLVAFLFGTHLTPHGQTLGNVRLLRSKRPCRAKDLTQTTQTTTTVCLLKRDEPERSGPVARRRHAGART